MSNQENSNLQSAQEDVQNLPEEQLEEVTGGVGNPFKKCFGCGSSTPSQPSSPVHQLDLTLGHPTPGRRNNNPDLSQSSAATEVRDMKQKLQNWINKG